MYICNDDVKILNDLPMRKWKGKMCVDNKSMVGINVDVEYKGDKYKGIHIVECIRISGNNSIFKIIYNGKQFDIRCSAFLKGKLGNVLGVKSSEFKYRIGQTFKDEKRDLVITDKFYKKNKKGYNLKFYTYECNRCPEWNGNYEKDKNEIYSILEGSLSIGRGCPVCANQTVVPHINSIWATDRWMVDLGVSEEDAKKYTGSSEKRITVKCPDCGKEKDIVIRNIKTNKSIGCACGDGSSYPEKFIFSLLQQLEVEFIKELSKTMFEWCENKRYDFYIPSLNMIIETHGVQHYEETGGVFRRTLQEEQENDRLKRELALLNGVEYYIELDCRKSDLEYIRYNILNSKLNELFDLTKIDWLKCEEFALKNIIKQVCDYWNNKEEWETPQTIAKNNEWGIKSSFTIVKYVEKGEKLGWCDYFTDCENKLIETRNKKVDVFKEDVLLGTFDSLSDLERKSELLFGVKLFHSGVSMVCNKKRLTYKGYTFKYSL